MTKSISKRLILGACALFAAPLSLALENGTYTIASMVSGKLVEVANASTADGANIAQWPNNGGANQRWIITKEGDGYVSIINENSGKAMEIYNFDTSDGANVVQWNYWGGDPQLWRVEEHGNGVVSFINRHSDKALDLYNFDTADGANIAQWSYWGGDAQRWQLATAGGSSGGGGNTPPDTSTTGGETNHWQLSGNLVTHDPTITYENGTWYLYQTGPGIYGKISSDGLNWNGLPSVFPNGLDWWSRYVPDHDGIDVWAPEVKHYNGRAWLYYSISTFGSRTSVIGLASADSLAAGNWRDEGAVISTNNSSNYNAIDPDLVVDANGDPWLAFGSWNSGIKLTRLNPSTMKPTGNLYSLASRGGGIEAPTIIYRQGYYYLFVSVGRCCAGVDSTYNILYGRASSITGPYLDKNGNNMMNGGGSLLDGGNGRWIGPGGQDIANTDVIARHAYDATDNGTPKLLISTLNWDASGWPRY